MALWVYRRRFTVAGMQAVVRMDAGMNSLDSVLTLDGRPVARDRTDFSKPDGARNHRLAATLPDGRLLEVEAGYNSWWGTGIVARLDGAVVHESHPGRPLEMPRALRDMLANQTSPEAQAKAAEQQDRWRANRPSIIADVALGILFFVTAKYTDLPTAAIVGAVAGLALVVAQRFVKVDLLGGLALFGVVMLLISAGFSILFQDDWAVKMRSTIVGLIGAGLFLADAALGGGRHLGARMARYMPMPDLDPQRLALGMGVVGVTMAALNYGVASLFSTNVWLFYTTFLDTALVIAMMFAILRFARRPQAVAGGSAA